MLLEIYGVNYYLHLTATSVGSHLDVQIVDEAFCETPLITKHGNASEISEMAERYSGMQIIDQQKLKIAEYYRRVQYPESEKIQDLDMECHQISPRVMAESGV